jgi:hypothetical protein
MNKEDHSSRIEAWMKDTELYADLDEQSGLWCVFGNNSGFAYKNSMDEQQAKDYAAELNKNKQSSIKYE